MFYQQFQTPLEAIMSDPENATLSPEAAEAAAEAAALAKCLEDRKMGLYVLSSLATFATFGLLVLIPRWEGN